MKDLTTLSRRLALVLLSVGLVAAPTAFASHGHDRSEKPEFSRDEAAIGPDQAAALVRTRTGGRVLGVRAVRRGERLHYRVKVLKSGYVRIYRVDANSGVVTE